MTTSQTIYPALTIPYRTGIVPTPATIANYNRQRMPNEPADRRLLDTRLNHEGVYSTLQSVVGDLGLGLEKERSWKSYLSDAIHTSPNAVAFRQSFYAKAREDRLDPQLCRALLLRCSQYARQRAMGKSQGIYTADALLKSGAAPDGDDDAPGPASYDDIKQAQAAEPSAGSQSAAQAAQDFVDLLSGGEQDGIAMDDLADLVEQYGPDLMASVLKATIDDGQAKFSNGKFYGILGKSFVIPREPL